MGRFRYPVGLMLVRLKNSYYELFKYKDVLINILSQDLKIKYKRTFFGYLWSLLNPVLNLLVLSVVFSHVVKLGMKDYTLYLFAGLLPWTFFQSSVSMAATSLLEAESFIKKVYLPKIIFPFSKMLIRGIDFIFALVALSILGLVLGFHLKWTAVMIPLAVLCFSIFTLGCCFLVSVITVYFRDTAYLLGIFLQLLYFATPIIWPLNVFPEKYRHLVALNPLVIQLDLFQKLLCFGEIPSTLEWATAMGMSVVVLFSGLILLIVTEEDLVFRM